jgi:hypothetical protein
MRLPLVPILLAIGGVLVGASLFATWFDVGVEGVRFSGFEPPAASEVEAVRASLAQTGWEFWDGGDAALLLLGIGLVGLAIFDAVRHEVPHRVLFAAGLLCAVALGVLLADGFTGDSIALVEGSLGENAGEVQVTRERAGGQWVALIGLLVALAGLGLGWRERRPQAD